MGGAQKIINLLSIVATIGLVYILNSQLSQTHQPIETELSLLQTVAQGEQLTEQQLTQLDGLPTELSNNSTVPSCVLKAYKHILAKKINPGEIFALFANKTQQYAGISSCKQAYDLLIYRAQIHDQAHPKEPIAPLLIDYKHSSLPGASQGQKSKVCMYLDGYNSQDSIKWQMRHLLDMSDIGVVPVWIETDGNTDNTHILAKYALDQSISKEYNIMITRNAERKGLLNGIDRFIKERCGKEQMIIVARSNERLIGRDLVKLVGQANSDFVYFKTFGNYTNLDQISLQAPILSPVYAIRASVLKNLLPQLINRAKFIASADLQKELLFYSMFKKQPTELSDVVSFRREGLALSLKDKMSQIIASLS